ncbi:MAG: TRAM domain-containing protein [Candidatus Saccharimonadales bacterium]
MEEVKITKLVHGGQGLGELADGRKVFVWNALPGETVKLRIIKKKHSYAEAIAEEIITASPDRLVPREANYLSTSPWQIMSLEVENKAKAEIVHELFRHEKVELPKFGEVIHDNREWNYRSKMEYSFWGDEDGLHLALHQRGSHGKQVVSGSALAMPAIDAAANAICTQLDKLNARAGDLKTIIVRVSQRDEAVAALYTKLEKFTKLELPAELKGLRVYYSNPKSPASVPTKLIYELGDCQLADDLLGQSFIYDVDSFFQVNLPVFEKALARIKQYCQGDPVDMYAGVGSIGLTVATDQVELVELDPATAAMARLNAESSSLSVTVTEAPTEKVLDSIVEERPVIFDPPRAGLHSKVVERCLEVLPPQIIYLSCNPATQARDLALLQDKYQVSFFEIYNFFPRTPHIEVLAILTKKLD